MKKFIITLALLILTFAPFAQANAPEKKFHFQFTEAQVQGIIEGLRKSRIESWQSAEYIDLILKQANDTSINKR